MTRGYKTPSSGMHKWTRDLSGKTFGQLTVAAFAGYKGKPTRHAHWECVCTCGDRREVRATRLIHGQVRACAACSLSAAAAKGGNTRSLDGDEAAFRRLCDWYRNNADKRELEFALDQDSLRKLFSGACYYCGAPPSQVCKSKSGRSEFTYNGIDRMKNSVGYIESNVVPCCPLCNYAKREMEEDDFISWIEQVYAHTRTRHSRSRID